ncbi:MAG: DUF2029 domain-containing protein [Saccharothrix sp.]|nr:DUF2029 domain-containing protein [Saccharothrix sp.]
MALVRAFPDAQWFMGDLGTYHEAVSSLRSSQDALYRDLFGDAQGPFLYPPFAALVFRELLPLGMGGLKLLMAVSGHLALLATAYAAWGMLGCRRDAGRLGAALLTAGGALWLEPVQKTFMWGQVGLLLMALVLLDCARADTARWKGVGIGIAAGFKLTPALFVLYLLCTRRFRAAGVAVGAFAVTVVVGFLALPGAAWAFWFRPRAIAGHLNEHVLFADGTNQSLWAAIVRLVGENTLANTLWYVLAAACLGAGMAAAAVAARGGRELLGVVLCATVALLASPISWSHHWVWCVPACVVLADQVLGRRRLRTRLPLLAAYVAVMAVWPVRVDMHGAWDAGLPVAPYGLVWLAPHQDGLELHWNAWQALVGDSMLLVNAAAFTAVVAVLLRGRLSGPGPRTPRVPRPPSRSAHAATAASGRLARRSGAR